MINAAKINLNHEEYIMRPRVPKDVNMGGLGKVSGIGKVDYRVGVAIES